MSWIVPQADDILAWLSSPELTAFTNAASAPGQADRLQAQLDTTAAEVRGYVGACERFRDRLGAMGTIPEELAASFWAVVVFRFLHTLPARGVITSQRQLEYEKAVRRLEQVALCEFEVAPPGALPGTDGLTFGRFGSYAGPFLEPAWSLGGCPPFNALAGPPYTQGGA